MTSATGRRSNTPGTANSVPPRVSVTAPVDTAAEGGAPGSFRLTRTGSTDGALEVAVTTGGTAAASDWTPPIAGTVTIPAGSASIDLGVAAVDDDELEGPESLVLQIATGDGYAQGDPASATVTLVDDDAPACFVEDTAIGTVQGTGAESPLKGQSVTVQGTVVADYEHSDSLRGFYLQDTGDGDTATSDGIFVFQGNDDEVSLGDVVQVTGTVAEFQGQTQLNGGSVVEDCGIVGSVAPTEVTLPVATSTTLERYEGMLVTFPQQLFVTEHFQLGRFGQVTVSSGDRLTQPTSVALPGEDALAVQAANDLNRLVVDDDLQTQNPDPIKLARDEEPLTAENTLRGGDTVTGLTGVLTYTWGGNSSSPKPTGCGRSTRWAAQPTSRPPTRARQAPRRSADRCG